MILVFDDEKDLINTLGLDETKLQTESLDRFINKVNKHTPIHISYYEIIETGRHEGELLVNIDRGI